MYTHDLGSHLGVECLGGAGVGDMCMVGQEEPERTVLGESDSIAILLWEINCSSQAVYKNAGSDVQRVLALLSGS